MRVCVVGMGKSGTTALLYAIRAAMPAGTQVLFEPRTFVAVTAQDAAAKVLLHPKHPMPAAFYGQFDRLVLIVRDPRDVLISRVLYRAYGATAMLSDPAKLARYLDLLRAKEADPRAVSVRQINEVFQSMGGSAAHSDEGRTRMLADALAFHEAFPAAFVYRYETMVEGDFDALADYLSLPAARMTPEVPEALRRVERSRRAGNWRDWFCPEDVAHFRPLLAPYMARYGYDDGWTLADAPVIRPAECSEYVMRLVRERRGNAAALQGAPRD